MILFLGGSAGQRQCLEPAVKRLVVVGHALEARARTLHSTRAKHHRLNAQRRSVPRNIEKGRGVIHGAANGSINCINVVRRKERCVPSVEVPRITLKGGCVFMGHQMGQLIVINVVRRKERACPASKCPESH